MRAQEFDRVEPSRLILPVWLEIILVVHSQERQTCNVCALSRRKRGFKSRRGPSRLLRAEILRILVADSPGGSEKKHEG